MHYKFSFAKIMPLDTATDMLDRYDMPDAETVPPMQMYLLPGDEWNEEAWAQICRQWQERCDAVLAQSLITPERIQSQLEDKDPAVRVAAVRYIGNLSAQQQRDICPEDVFEGGQVHPLRLAQWARQEGGSKDATSPEGARRIPMEKTGSRLTVLDGGKNNALHDMVVHSDIPAQSLAAWKAAYEAHDFWAAQGVDYVPIVPILRAYPQRPGYVRVASRILGSRAKEWLDEKKPFSTQIRSQIQAIKQGLAQLGIKHGHDHDENFCLVFTQGENGKPDYTQCPRVYVIDFDAAKIIAG